VPPYPTVRKKKFSEDLALRTARDVVLRHRVELRIEKLGSNPKHHGYHAGDSLRCNWVAGVGDWAIVYEIDEVNLVVILLRFLPLDDV